MRDVLLDDDNDMVVVGGDMVVGDITQQMIKHVVMATPGEYKEYPMLGVGMIMQINGNRNQFVLNNIKEQLAAVGIAAKNVAWDDEGELLIEY